MAVNNQYGIWGHNLITNNLLFSVYSASYKGFHFRFDWGSWETGANAWDDSYITSQFNRAATASLQISFLVFISPVSGGATPTYVFSPPYNVPSVNTDRDSYPYYYNETFQTRQFNMYDRMITAISSSFPASLTSKIVAWQIAEGTTGDDDPYKGTISSVTINGVAQPDSASYNITDATWTPYKRYDLWPTFSLDITSSIPAVKMLMNPGNDARNFLWAVENLPGTWLKAGNPAHTYNLSGELFYVERLRSIWTSGSNNYRVRGELEETPLFPWWTQAKKANLFSVICSCAHHGVDMLNISPTYAWDMVGLDLWGFKFANRHFGIRSSSETNTGFCAFRKIIDFADTASYSEATYGTLVSSSDQAAYNAAYNAITVDPDLDYWTRQVSYLYLLAQGKTGGVTYLNPNRINAITASFPGTEYRGNVDVDQEADVYDQDYGVYMIPGNYYKYVEQYDPDGTSKPAWRLNSTGSWFGRFARGFDVSSSKTEMFFKIDTGLDNNGVSGNNVTVNVTYYDTGSGMWSLNAATLKGKSEVMVNRNTGTNEWLIKSVTFDGFLFSGSLANDSDLTLKYLSGEETYFALLEFKNNSKILT